jgi:hypothetical protein
MGVILDEAAEEIQQIIAYFRDKKIPQIVHANKLKDYCADFANFKIFAGFLFIPLSSKENFFAIFLRKSRMKVLIVLTSRKFGM